MKIKLNINEDKRNNVNKLTMDNDVVKTNLTASSVHAIKGSPQFPTGNGILLRLPKVLERFPVARSTWYAGVRAGIYPKPYLISRRVVAWTQASIDALIASQGMTGDK